MHNPLSTADFASRCPACAHTIAVPFFDAGAQPLATLAFPETREKARGLPRYRLRFVRCADCGHVYNPEFDYDQVPYAKHPNKMFNLGTIWCDHLEQVGRLILDSVPESPCVVEIGCGDGHLLRSLAEARPDGRYVGFDPNAKVDTGNGMIEARAELFLARRHLAELSPHMIVARHVLEHLVDPLALLQEIAFAASCHRQPTKLFVEVPCVDLAIEACRMADFFYEHNSHFTLRSLAKMLDRSGAEIESIEKGYGGEVVYAVASMLPLPHQDRFGREAGAFGEKAEQAARTLAAQLDAIAASNRRVAIWGGTGKAAALINQCNMDAERFPLVVDSDLQKAGTFVPGMGQFIHYRDVLLKQPADLIIIATQWRAADIVLEMQRMGIGAETVLIEHQGRLIDYFHEDHPYRQVARPTGSAWYRAESHSPLAPPVGVPPWSTAGWDVPVDAAGS